MNFSLHVAGRGRRGTGLFQFRHPPGAFIRYDSLGYQEVKQALQEFIFNINVPTRVGFQTPFTNVTLDLTVPKYLRQSEGHIGGEMQPETYRGFPKRDGPLQPGVPGSHGRGRCQRAGCLPFPFPLTTLQRILIGKTGISITVGNDR